MGLEALYLLMKPRFSIPPIPEAERTPLVTLLLGLIEDLAERVQKQDEQIALEGLVAQHLRAWCGYTRDAHQLHYWHTRTGVEVDFVVYGPSGTINEVGLNAAHSMDNCVN
jgi:predicted AAA+ superfamily ATPase